MDGRSRRDPRVSPARLSASTSDGSIRARNSSAPTVEGDCASHKTSPSFFVSAQIGGKPCAKTATQAQKRAIRPHANQENLHSKKRRGFYFPTQHKTHRKADGRP